MTETEPAPPSIHKVEIIPTAFYPRNEAAWLLGLYGKHAEQRVRQIPEILLPVTRTGPNNGRVGYRGFDLLRYLDGQRSIDGKAAPPDRRMEAA